MLDVTAIEAAPVSLADVRVASRAPVLTYSFLPAKQEPPMIKLDEIDFSNPEVFRNGFPHEIFETLRDEAPIWWHPAKPGTESATEEGFWVFSRYADIQAANRDTETFSAEDGPTLQAVMDGASLMLTNMDGARHVRQRKLISSGFTPRMTRRLEEQARGWAVDIIENALERETVNFVQDIAYQLPMHMIADIVGIPLEDRNWIFARINEMLTGTTPERLGAGDDRDGLLLDIFQYGAQLSESKRKKPADDVWSTLTSAEVTSEDGTSSSLSPIELDGFFVLLTAAGSETTRNAISQGLLALLEHPDQFAALRADPGKLKSATEEILRWTSPVSYFRRTVKRDTEFEGTKLRAGERISIWYPSGNRDPRAFEAPERFDIERTPNEQIAFGGGGPHFCLGAHLARREITILFEELLRRVGDIEIVGEPSHSVQGIGNPISVSLQEYPVRLSRASD